MNGAGAVRALAGAVLVLSAVACDAAALPTAGWLTMAWTLIDPSPGQEGPLALADLDGRYVGVGGSSAWLSDDLRTWEAVAVGDGETVDLTAFDRGLVAVGSVGGGSGQRAAIWRSEDGELWLQADDANLAPVPGYGSSRAVAVAAAPAGVVVVGTEWGDAGQRPVAWLSRDGRTWRRAADPIEGNSAMDVTATETGFVMAGAGVARAGEVTRTRFWFSADGLGWTAVADDPSFGNRQPSGIARGPDGTAVAGGLEVTATGWLKPALWSSSDGQVWAPVPEASSLGPWAAPGPTPPADQGVLQGTAVSAIGWVGDGFIAAGMRWGLDPGLPEVDGAPTLRWHAVLWHSADGRSWELLPDDPDLALGVTGSFEFGPRWLSRYDDTVVVLGVTAELGATIWLADAPTLSVGG